jgi:hypothetical protein
LEGLQMTRLRTARQITTEAERRLPVRIRVAVPPGGFGQQLTAMYAWLDESCGLDGWATAPSGIRGVVNDAVAFYFRDARFAVAFVTRWCGGAGEAVAGGAFEMREDEPARRVPAPDHRNALTPAPAALP